MNAKRRANTLKPLRQVFSFRKESKTITLTKSNPCTHVLSCSAKFNDLLCHGLCMQEGKTESQSFSLDRALYVIAISVLDMGVMYLWPWV